MEHSFIFPAIRGIQANREYFVSMCPMRVIPRIFLFDEEELSPEVRAQRTLNRNRIPEIARYILRYPESYAFSALTASIDGDVEFQPIETESQGVEQLGQLTVPMQSKFVINDGQHRRAAIEMALRENPSIGSETISVVFYLDNGLERSQQLFSDLNRHAVKPSRSLGVLYDHRDEMAEMTRLVVFSSDFLKPLVELEKTSLSLRSRKLFTLSSLHNANEVLVQNFESKTIQELADIAVDYWETVAENIPHWKLVHATEMSAGEVRKEYLNSHSLSLEALARVGSTLLTDYTEDWKERLRGLEDIDWARSNSAQWEGRALSSGRVVKSRQHVILTSSIIKRHLGLPLNEKEEAAEDELQQQEVDNE